MKTVEAGQDLADSVMSPPADDPVNSPRHYTRGGIECGLLRDLLDYDSETGVFTWLVSRKAVKAGDVAGTNTGAGYRQLRINGRAYFAHLMAWLHFYGRMPCGHIDHINGDKSDNRIANLRDVDRTANAQNQRRAHKSNKSTGVLGVSFNSARGKYCASIKTKGRSFNLGGFDTIDEAQAAYLEAKRRVHAGWVK